MSINSSLFLPNYIVLVSMARNNKVRFNVVHRLLHSQLEKDTFLLVKKKCLFLEKIFKTKCSLVRFL